MRMFLYQFTLGDNRSTFRTLFCFKVIASVVADNSCWLLCTCCALFLFLLSLYALGFYSSKYRNFVFVIYFLLVDAYDGFFPWQEKVKNIISSIEECLTVSWLCMVLILLLLLLFAYFSSTYGINSCWLFSSDCCQCVLSSSLLFLFFSLSFRTAAVYRHHSFTLFIVSLPSHQSCHRESFFSRYFKIKMVHD